MNKIVLLSGPQGSGKTTIQRELGIHYRALNFASVIYQIHDFAIETVRTYGIPMPQKDGKLLQMLGTEWGRAYDKDIWIKIMRYRVDNLVEQGIAVCIGDCRFENEFDAFPDALRVRLTAPEDVRKKRAEAWRTNTTHPSETDLDDYEMQHKFDLYLDTAGDMKAAECAKIILAHPAIMRP